MLASSVVHVNSQPLLRETGRRLSNVLYRRKCRNLPECCGIVEDWEQKRILKYCGEKYKKACFLLWSKWIYFYFCLGLFKAK